MIFGGSQASKRGAVAEPRAEVQHGVGDQPGVPAPNYGMTGDPQQSWHYSPPQAQQGWPYDTAGPYRSAGSPYSSTPQYSASPFQAGPYGQPYGAQAPSPYQNPKYG
jgi:hypothetical protein